MRNWREAVNGGVRRATGYQLVRADRHGDDSTGPRHEGLDEAVGRQGYRLERLAKDAHVVVRETSGRPILVDPVGKHAWLVQRGGGNQREVVQIGNDGLRTHLVMDADATRAKAPALQRHLGQYLAHEMLSWVLRSMGVDLVLDVGANIGQFATRLREHGYTGRIVSFEPVPRLADRLRERAKGDPDWLVYGCALGSEDGTAEINASPGTMSSLLEPNEFGKEWAAELTDVHTEVIPVRRLDSMWEEITAGTANPRVYMKLDTQGFDLEAFEGAGERIQQVVALQSEVACLPIYEGMTRLPESLSVYEAAGFEIAGMYPVTYHRQTLRVIEFDMLMVRGSAAQDATDGEAPAER